MFVFEAETHSIQSQNVYAVNLNYEKLVAAKAIDYKGLAIGNIKNTLTKMFFGSPEMDSFENKKRNIFQRAQEIYKKNLETKVAGLYEEKKGLTIELDEKLSKINKLELYVSAVKTAVSQSPDEHLKMAGVVVKREGKEFKTEDLAIIVDAGKISPLLGTIKGPYSNY